MKVEERYPLLMLRIDHLASVRTVVKMRLCHCVRGHPRLTFSENGRPLSFQACILRVGQGRAEVAANEMHIVSVAELIDAPLKKKYLGTSTVLVMKGV